VFSYFYTECVLLLLYNKLKRFRSTSSTPILTPSPTHAAHTSGITGTVQYMAPEVMRSEDYDESVDVYRCVCPLTYYVTYYITYYTFYILLTI
jgi:serine/threonine protein kinase